MGSEARKCAERRPKLVESVGSNNYDLSRDNVTTKYSNVDFEDRDNHILPYQIVCQPVYTPAELISLTHNRQRRERFCEGESIATMKTGLLRKFYSYPV